jgi:hypothetical protein
MKKVIKHIHNGVGKLNESKFFTGIMMIMLNIGSKYVTVKLSKSQESYIRNYIAREILIFSVCWMGTRDIYTSILLTSAFFILTQHLFNEESDYCILPQKYRTFHLFDTNNDGEISKQEINDAVSLLTKAKQQNINKDKEAIHKYFLSNK